MHQFMPMASKVKEYNGKKWVKTGHDLDFVFKRDGIDYGCEIKNTLGYCRPSAITYTGKLAHKTREPAATPTGYHIRL